MIHRTRTTRDAVHAIVLARLRDAAPSAGVAAQGPPRPGEVDPVAPCCGVTLPRDVEGEQTQRSRRSRGPDTLDRLDGLRCRLRLGRCGPRWVIRRRQPQARMLRQRDRCVHVDRLRASLPRGWGAPRWDPSATATAMCESCDAGVRAARWQPMRTQAQARMAVFEFLEGWYNPTRRHSALGYLSPNEFEARHAECEEARLRPGRPPSRPSLVGLQEREEEEEESQRGVAEEGPR